MFKHLAKILFNYVLCCSLKSLASSVLEQHMKMTLPVLLATLFMSTLLVGQPSELGGEELNLNMSTKVTIKKSI